MFENNIMDGMVRAGFFKYHLASAILLDALRLFGAENVLTLNKLSKTLLDGLSAYVEGAYLN